MWPSLLVILYFVNGMEPAGHMAVRFYDSENEVCLRLAQVGPEPFLGGPAEAVRRQEVVCKAELNGS